MVSDEKMERALEYLADTDERVAHLHADCLRAEYLADVAESLAYKMAEGTVEDRKREAKATQAVKDAKDKYFAAVVAYEAMRAKRKRAELTVDVWRSINANRRMAA